MLSRWIAELLYRVVRGQDWRKQEYYKRRRCLSQLLTEDDTKVLSAVCEESVDSQKHLEKLYEKWSVHGESEGIIIIKPVGYYRSGRVTKEKAKLKRLREKEARRRKRESRREKQG